MIHFFYAILLPSEQAPCSRLKEQELLIRRLKDRVHDQDIELNALTVQVSPWLGGLDGQFGTTVGFTPPMDSGSAHSMSLRQTLKGWYREGVGGV